MRSLCTAALAVLTVVGWSAPSVRALELASGGRARLVIVHADSATGPERQAVEELREYLEQVTGAPFTVLTESDPRSIPPAIYVGWTAPATRATPSRMDLGEEEWVVRTSNSGLAIYGGRPRGTLYGVYRFLERWVGVNWWTPFDESVPQIPELTLSRIDEQAAPAFRYRDIAIENGPPLFRAHRMLNGHFSRLPTRLGGSSTFSSPHHTHTAFLFVPPDELYRDHPHLFSEIGGMRFGGDTQLCLSQREVVDRMVEQLLLHVARSRERAARLGFDPPVLVSVSQNDWGRPCECSACSQWVEEGGSQSAPWIRFVNEVARRVARSEPELMIETLAYGYTLDPPGGLVTEPNVVLRISGLHQRDFLRPVEDPANAVYRAALLGWSDLTQHLHVWDYTVPFGEHGNLPLPNLEILAQDLAFYLDSGTEGVYLQAEDPIADDMRDLTIWVVSRLLVDPRQSVGALVRQFTDGYYGNAGRAIRRYLKILGRSARRSTTAVRYGAAAEDHAYLDADFFRDAHRTFDLAERKVFDQRDRQPRVRHARLALDRATLTRWSVACGAACEGADFERVARRYRGTWFSELRRRLAAADLDAAMAEVDREIAYWRERRGPPRRFVDNIRN